MQSPSAHTALCRKDRTEHHSVIRDGSNGKITEAKDCEVAVAPIKCQRPVVPLAQVAIVPFLSMFRNKEK